MWSEELVEHVSVHVPSVGACNRRLRVSACVRVSKNEFQHCGSTAAAAREAVNPGHQSHQHKARGEIPHPSTSRCRSSSVFSGSPVCTLQVAFNPLSPSVARVSSALVAVY